MKFIFLFSFFLFSICKIVIAGGTSMSSIDKKIINHKIYIVTKINEDNSMELSNGSRIFLLGIDFRDNKQFLNFLKETINKKVILENDAKIVNGKDYYVYLWGSDHDDLLDFLDKSSFEYKGFLDVQENGNIKKGLALFLNATIIKSGIARTKIDQQFSLKEQFLKWEVKKRSSGDTYRIQDK